MKKLILCAPLIALFGANAEANLRIENNTGAPASISLIIGGGALQHLVTLQPNDPSQSVDITPYLPKDSSPDVEVHFRYNEIARLCIPELGKLPAAEINKKTLVIEKDKETGGTLCRVQG